MKAIDHDELEGFRQRQQLGGDTPGGGGTSTKLPEGSLANAIRPKLT